MSQSQLNAASCSSNVVKTLAMLPNQPMPPQSMTMAQLPKLPQRSIPPVVSPTSGTSITLVTAMQSAALPSLEQLVLRRDHTMNRIFQCLVKQGHSEQFAHHIAQQMATKRYNPTIDAILQSQQYQQEQNNEQPGSADYHHGDNNMLFKSDMPASKRPKLDIDINRVLPTEILRKILQKSDIKSLCMARQVCKRWKAIIDGFHLVEEASKKINCLVITGRATSTNYMDFTYVKVVSGEQGNCLPRNIHIKLPFLPKGYNKSPIVLNNGTILACGGDDFQKCFQLVNGAWMEHSNLNRRVKCHSVVTTQLATFIFGGFGFGGFNCYSYEYLPKDSTKWFVGWKKIPGGFIDGCAIALKPDREIWLIGGLGTERRILSFNVIDHTFCELPFQLNEGRVGFRCAFIPNSKKIMITGGSVSNGASTEIVNTVDGSVKRASPMNYVRNKHGMGVITIKGENRLAVFGGINGANRYDCVETYNTQTEKWEFTNFN